MLTPICPKHIDRLEYSLASFLSSSMPFVYISAAWDSLRKSAWNKQQNIWAKLQQTYERENIVLFQTFSYWPALNRSLPFILYSIACCLSSSDILLCFFLSYNIKWILWQAGLCTNPMSPGLWISLSWISRRNFVLEFLLRRWRGLRLCRQKKNKNRAVKLFCG